MNLAPFQFERSELWESVHVELAAFLDAATADALAAQTLGELRIHAAGRAEALAEFRAHLNWLRAEAEKRRG